MHKSDHLERRKYIRLNSVFPVEIYIPNGHNDKPARLIQAFTRDVSLGGLRLSINDPDQSFLSVVTTGSSPLDLAINMPVGRKPIEARVKVAWHEIRQLSRHRRLTLGVSYLDITLRDRQKIYGAARRIKWLPRIGVFLVVILLCLIGALAYSSSQLRMRNEELIKRFYRAQEEGELYSRSVMKMGEKYEAIKSILAQNDKLSESLRSQLAALKIDDPQSLTKERSRLEEQLAAAIAEKSALESQLEGIVERKARAARLLDESRGQRLRLAEATTNNMYQWLKTHRNRFTGLVISFEGDPAIRDWAFTYDQALVLQVFLISGDREMAEQILVFFKDKAARRNGGFANAYNAMIGTPAEEVVHLGPNIWIAISAVHYANRTGDRTYLDMAQKIADWIISLKDGDGGIPGGPGLSWYSTEHNLDAYALFNMLYIATGKELYRKEMVQTLEWIKDYTYSASEGRMNRGKGDSTIATDTPAWAIATIGPATLAIEGMDPDAIIKFAEDNCLVSTYFNRPDGETVNIKGFDFAKASNVARSGVVSTEWTAQMIISYMIMADYYKELGDKDKSGDYSEKAAFYLAELDKMIISSPSPSGQGAGCLPYASQPNADTGHGWRTPAGVQTGSVSGTAYALFAKKGYNPLGAD